MDPPSVGRGPGGEMWLVLQQLQSVETQIREQMAALHNAHTRLEDKMESRFIEVIANLRGGLPPADVPALRRPSADTLRRLSGVDERRPSGEDDDGAGSVQTRRSRRSLAEISAAGTRTLSPRARPDSIQDYQDNALVEMAPSRHNSIEGANIRAADFFTTGTKRSAVRWSRSTLSSIRVRQSESRFFPFHPSSTLVRMYDLLIFVLLICELVAVPYQVAFDVSMAGSTFFAVLAYVAVTCWTLDLVSGFMIGAYKKGELVMDMKLVAILYLKGEFLMNLVTQALDILNIVAETVIVPALDGEHSLSLRLLKLARFLRVCVKLLGLGGTRRASNLADSIASAVGQRGMSRQVEHLLQVSGALFVILLVNHLGACAWWMLGPQSIELYSADVDLPNDRRSQYYLSYYVSVSLMIAGTNIVKPATASEILCTITGIYVGFVFVSVVISKVATHLIDWHMANKENSDRVRLLQKYLQQRRVETQVAIPVEKQIFERLRSVKWLSEKDVPVLSILSPTLRAELACSVYGGAMRLLPLIVSCSTIDVNYVKDVCYNALCPEVLDPGNRIFEPGDEAVGAWFMSWGVCEYHASTSGSPMTTGSQATSGAVVEAQEVPLGTWVSEIAIWISWHHRGCMECSKTSELLKLEAGSLMRILRHRTTLKQITRDYMGAVADAIAVTPEDRLTDLSKCVDHETVITCMPLESRRHLSFASLEMLNTGGSWVRPFSIKGFKELSCEVASGACDLIVDKEDHVKRVVSVVALKLVNYEGRVLARIAEKKGQTLVPELRLPGTKVRGGELPATALHRFLESQFKDLGPSVEIDHREVLIEERLSPSFGVNTKYVRTVFHATFDSGDGTKTSPRPSIRRSGAGSEPALPEATAPQVAAPMLGGRISTHRHAFLMRANTLMRGNTHFDLPSSKYEAIFLADAQSSGNFTVCAWMDETEFNSLISSNMGEAAAKQWVHALGIDRPDGPDAAHSAGGDGR